MPVQTRVIKGKVRTVGADGKIEMTPQGNPRDGGGQSNTPAGNAKAERQVGYINAALAKAEPNTGGTKPLPGTAAARRKPKAAKKSTRTMKPM